MRTTIGKPAPTFALRDADGKLRRSDEFLGSPLVLELTRHLY